MPRTASQPLPPADAIALLIADHRRVDELFKQFEAEDDNRTKAALATEICNELTVHATVEEEIFYPQTVGAFEVEGVDEKDLVWEATVEHGTLEGLIASLDGVDADDEMFDAHVKVLKEYVKHHVKEEEGEMFPKVRRTGLDLEALGAAMQARKEELMAEMDGRGRAAKKRAPAKKTGSRRR